MKSGDAKRIFRTVFILIGLGLFLVNLYGLTQSVRHSDIQAFDAGRTGPGLMSEIPYDRISAVSSFGIRMTRADALAAYAKVRDLPDETARIRRIREIVTESTVHHYPENTPGTAFAIPFHENFVLWGLAQFSPLFVRLGFAPLDPYEFLDGAKSWERGAGICGQLSSAAWFLLEDSGIKAGKAALDGHVVALARTADGREFVLDPDFGLTFEGTLTSVAENPARVYGAAIAAGHSAEAARNHARLYGPEGNVEFWNGDRGYRPVGYWAERGAYWLKWVFPGILVLLGLARRKPAMRQRQLGATKLPEMSGSHAE